MASLVALVEAPCGGELEWRGCYSGQYDLWTAESYAHPAKMAPGLAFKILAHLEELGLLQQGGTVLDPMAGIGTSLLVAAIRGYRAVGVELESRFVSMARANAERIGLKGFGAPIEVIQGDARRLSELLAEKGMVSVVSPPYGDGADRGGGIDWAKSVRPDFSQPSPNRHNVEGLNPGGYGTSEGQIGRLPDVAITSPPYTSSQTSDEHFKIQVHSGYFARIRQGRKPDDPFIGGKQPYTTPQTEGQIANLPDTVTVTSPPYEDTQSRNRFEEPSGMADRDVALLKRSAQKYGQSNGQLGQERNESYLSAMRQVYAEIAKVSPVLVVVVKDPTRNGQLRLLGQDTWLLMEQVGYKIIDYHQAILFEEQEQGHLLDGSVKKPKGRLGFFKRLAYRKGSEVASYEHVIVGIHQSKVLAQR